MKYLNIKYYYNLDKKSMVDLIGLDKFIILCYYYILMISAIMETE